MQKPVRELMQQAKDITDSLRPQGDQGTISLQNVGRKALIIRAKLADDYSAVLRWNIHGSLVEYDSAGGRFAVGEESCQVLPGQKDLLLIVDDKILEVFFDGGVQMGTFALEEAENSLEVPLDGIGDYAIYEVE